MKENIGLNDAKQNQKSFLRDVYERQIEDKKISNSENSMKKREEADLISNKQRALEEEIYRKNEEKKSMKNALAQHYENSIGYQKEMSDLEKRRKIDEERRLLEDNQRYYDEESLRKREKKEKYKQEIQEQLQQKEYEKMLEKEKKDRENYEYKQKMDERNFGNAKEANYKNYYKNVAERQNQYQKNYTDIVINNGDSKSKKIDDFINKGISERNQREEEEKLRNARKKMDEKNAMRTVLEAQIQQKEVNRESHKRDPYRSDEMYRRVVDIEESKKVEINRKKEEQARYREILDYQQKEKVNKRSVVDGNNKDFMLLDSTSQSNNPVTGRKANSSTPIIKSSNQMNVYESPHNPLSNPIPYNVQNPYILKEYQKHNMPAQGGVQNRNYLAQVATNNLIGNK